MYNLWVLDPEVVLVSSIDTSMAKDKGLQRRLAKVPGRKGAGFC